MTTWAIRFLAQNSTVFTDQFAFFRFREPDAWTQTQLDDELAKIKAHDPQGAPKYTDNNGDWLLYEIVFPNEWDFRLAETIGKALEKDDYKSFVFVPQGVVPQVEKDFSCHP